MQYPDRLINKAKKLYPNWSKLHELFEKGSPCILHLLHECQPSGSIPIVTILNAETIEELHQLANLEIEKSEFYLEMIAFVEHDHKERTARARRAIMEAHQNGEVLTI